MADWGRIRLGKAQVLGVNEEYSGLLDVDVPLEPTPDVHWSAIFERGPSGVGYSLSMHSLRLAGSSVRLRLPDDEVDRYIEALRERVEGTNDQYERDVLPRLRNEADAAERAEADRRRRIEEAQRRLDESSSS